MGISKARRRLLERLGNSRMRPRERSFVVEGARAVREALSASLPLDVRFCLVSPGLGESDAGRAVMGLLSEAAFPVEEVGDDDFASVSSTESPQGVLLVVREPEDPLRHVPAAGASRVLLLDRIQDPGNAGTLVRAARAFGLDAVLFLDGSVDPWNPKVVRSTAGAFAHLPLVKLAETEAVAWLGERRASLYVADAAGEDVAEFVPGPTWGLALGNEAAGPRGTMVEKASHRIAVTMSPGVDSLNVAMAGSILLFALSRFSKPGRETNGRERGL